MIDTSLSLIQAFHTHQLKVDNVINSLNNGKRDLQDTFATRQITTIETKLKTSKNHETQLENDLALMNIMVEAVDMGNDIFKQILSLSKKATVDGTLSTEIRALVSQIMVYRGDLYRALEKTVYLGQNVLNRFHGSIEVVNSEINGSPRLTQQFGDERLNAIYTTLDEIGDQDTVDAMILVIEDLQKATFDGIRQTVKTFRDAVATELMLNQSYQISLSDRINAIQGIDTQALLTEHTYQDWHQKIIISSLMAAEKSDQQNLSLLRYLPNPQ